MIAELMEARKIVSNFDKMILESPYKTEYISVKSNIPLPSFYRKLRDNKFSLDEIITIIEIIQPQQFEYEMLSKKIAIAEEQFKNGQFIEHKDFVFSAKKILENRK
jgi:predicted transcriptional regulator